MHVAAAVRAVLLLVVCCGGRAVAVEEGEREGMQRPYFGPGSR